MRFFSFIPMLVLLAVASTGPSRAEVRLGRNVFVGGHDFSHQTFDAERRAVVHLYDRTPLAEGCVWRSDGDGHRVKVCHLRRIGRR